MTAKKTTNRPVANPPHCFGSHLSVAGGVHHALTAAYDLGLSTVQVFVKNQRQWHAPPLKAEILDQWRRLRDKPEFGPIVAHASYLINLATEDPTLSKKSIDAFTDELLRCDLLDIPYLVVHPGSTGQQEVDVALGRVAHALDEILAAHPDLRCMPLLETTAGQGRTLGRSFAELGAICRLLDRHERVGVCIDTCHVFAAGYDIRDPRIYNAMIDEADREVGLKRVRCWHLNDSRGDCGSHLDRHEHIGRGRIGAAGFRNVLCDERFHAVPLILETPKGEDENGRDWDRINLQRLRTIHTRAQSRGRTS